MKNTATLRERIFKYFLCTEMMIVLVLKKRHLKYTAYGCQSIIIISKKIYFHNITFRPPLSPNLISENRAMLIELSKQY